MKPHGASCDYQDQRNLELLQAYRHALHLARTIRRDDIMRATVNSPTSRFWVSEQRAAIVIARMLKGDTLTHMRPHKREMFREILRRVYTLREIHPRESLASIVYDAVNSPAPQFYLTPGSAKVILSRIKKSWRRNHKIR